MLGSEGKRVGTNCERIEAVKGEIKVWSGEVEGAPGYDGEREWEVVVSVRGGCAECGRRM